MINWNNATAGANAGGGERATRVMPILLSAWNVADILLCTPKHVHRLAKAGRIPSSIKINSMVRWKWSDLEPWIAAGCPDCRNGWS